MNREEVAISISCFQIMKSEIQYFDKYNHNVIETGMVAYKLNKLPTVVFGIFAAFFLTISPFPK